jgi:hypothetical protein
MTSLKVGEIDKNIKVKAPDTFGGERSKFKNFVLQLEIYQAFNDKRFQSETERVLWTVTLLTGTALNWVEGFVADYLQNKDANGKVSSKMDDKTVEVFSTWEGFMKNFKSNFGEIDEHQTAVRAIYALRQKGSATGYTAEFQRYSVNTGWGDAALMDQYYVGLKDNIKDELTRRDKPDSLEELITEAVEIDNRFYERSLEKRGVFSEGRNTRYFPPAQRVRKQNTAWPQPMELDATMRREMSPQERQKHMTNKTCFKCGKTGHMARNCRQGERQGSRRELNATQQGRGGYNQMQLCATRYIETSDANAELAELMQQAGSSSDDYELVEHPSADTPDEMSEGTMEEEDPDADSDTYPELTEDDQWKYWIIAGTKSAREVMTLVRESCRKEEDRTLWKFQRSDRSPEQLRALNEEQAMDVSLRIFRMQRIVGTIDQQIAALDGTSRGQQYQDKLADNIDFREHLIREIESEKLFREDLRAAARSTPEDGTESTDDITRTDHPQHGSLAWAFCPYDGCLTHYAAKTNSGHWPKHKGSIIKRPRAPATPAGEKSKN